MSQTAQRGRNQAVMHPVGVRLHAVAGVTGRHPRRLVPPQACARGMPVPWPRHGAPASRARAVVAWQARLASSRRSGAVRQRSTAWAGRWACGRTSAGGQSARRRPRCTTRWATGPLRGAGGHAARRRRRGAPCRGVAAGEPCQALSSPGRRHGPAQGCFRFRRAGRPPRPTVRVGHRGRHAWRVASPPAVPTARADPPAGGPWRPWHTRQRPAPRSPSRRPRPRARPATAAANRRRAVALWPCPPGQRLLGPQSAGPLRRRCDRGAAKRRAAAGPPGPLPAQGSAATAGGQGGKRPPPLAQRARCSTAAVRAILDGMTNAGRRVKTAPVACHVLRRTLRSGVTATAPSGQGTPWAISLGNRAGCWANLAGRDCRYGVGESTASRDGAALAHGTPLGVWPMDGAPVSPPVLACSPHRLEASGEPSPFVAGLHSTNHKIRWNQIWINL